MTIRRSGLCTLALALFTAATGSALAQAAFVNGIGTAKFSTEGGAAVTRTTKTVPYFSQSFQYGGQTYPYTMVGSSPGTGTTTTVSTAIVPINFVFAGYGNYPLDGTTKVQKTVDSPIFSDYGFTSSAQPTQWGDGVQRATFWNNGQLSPDWHVRLAAPQVYPTQTIVVPKNQAQLFAFLDENNNLVVFSTMSASWFSAQLHNLLNQLHIDPTVVPIAATYNIFLYIKDPSVCCVLGYHGATSSLHGKGNQEVQTYIFASYTDHGIFGHFDDQGNFVADPIEDVHALSHEVSEWMNDPFINNSVPPWETPSAPQYGCSGTLETGDPLVGFAHNMTDPKNPSMVYHPQNQALLQWFARESPSSAIGGQYTYPDSIFTSPATGCGP